jgi:hypothetical protein
MSTQRRIMTLTSFPFCHQCSSLPTSEMRSALAAGSTRRSLLPLGWMGSLHRLHLPLCLGLCFGHLVRQIYKYATVCFSSSMTSSLRPNSRLSRSRHRAPSRAPASSTTRIPPSPIGSHPRTSEDDNERATRTAAC